MNQKIKVLIGKIQWIISILAIGGCLFIDPGISLMLLILIFPYTSIFLILALDNEI